MNESRGKRYAEYEGQAKKILLTMPAELHDELQREAFKKKMSLTLLILKRLGMKKARAQ